VEIVRLEASGTTDLNTQSRINVLTQVRTSINDIISEISKGTMTEKDISFMKSDIDTFLPAMSNLNTEIPTLIKSMGLSSFLSSLFPAYSTGDISGSAIAKQMFDAYGKNFFNNLSWDVALSYKGQAEQDIAKNYASAATDTLAAVTSGEDANAAPSAGYRGLLESVITSKTGITPTHVSVRNGSHPAEGSTPDHSTGADTHGLPQKLDWKERSKKICEQITARGMNPNDFGCLENPDAMRQESFSWRGYTRMVCNRLNTVYDTSVPFLCGCPPPTWPGWRQ